MPQQQYTFSVPYEGTAYFSVVALNEADARKRLETWEVGMEEPVRKEEDAGAEYLWDVAEVEEVAEWS